MDGCRYLSYKRDVIKINVTCKLCSGSLDGLVSLLLFLFLKERNACSINTKLDNETLQYAIENNIIDVSYVREQTEMNKRKEVLKKYGKCIWYSQSEQTWYCHIPDDSKKSGRKKVKRKKKSDIEDVVYNYYIQREYADENSARMNMTFAELFYEYMEHKKEQVQSGTVRRMMVDWEKFYVPYTAFVEKPFMQITKIDVDDFLNYIASTYNPKDKCFRNMCGIMKQTFEYAVDADYINKSPYRTSKVNRKNIVPTRKKSSEKEVFTQNEQLLLTAEMLHKAKVNDTYLIPWIILLDFEIGARIGEVLAISESDILNGRIHIHRQLTQEHDTENLNDIKSLGWIISDYTKSECGDRWIPLTPKALEYIEHIKTINRNTGNQFQDYLFYRPEKVITEHAVKVVLERGCETVNIPKRSPHKIRKTYASRLYSNGVSVSDIGKLLGHVDETTTLKHYIYSMDDTTELDDRVRNALLLNGSENGITRDQKIIRFESHKMDKIRKTPKNRGILRKI